MPAQATPEYRPSFHFTPAETWMNDPNGLIRHRGLYHLYFQTNPEGRDWGNISWGHAVSRDLLTWRELPVAIRNTATEMAFSGSVVWDRDNTSGLGDGTTGPLVALFTSAYGADDERRPGQQAQSLAVSTDEGLTWTRHPANPVLERGSREFRDPKVFWHEPTGRWTMVTVEADLCQVLVHSSPDLLTWRWESTFGPSGVHDGLWECPDLLEVPVEGSDESHWVLLLSMNPGGRSGGSGMQYFVGAFDGTTFLPDAFGARWFDHGPDQYAAVSFQGTEAPTVIGWMSNWAYGMTTPTHPWQSAMTLARTLTLVSTASGLQVRQTPILPPVPSDDLNRIEFEFTGSGHLALVWDGPPTPRRLVLSRSAAGDLVLDRSAADPHGTHVGFEATPPIPTGTGPVGGLLVEDHGLVEVFVDGGLTCLTMQTFPGAGRPTLEVGGDVRAEPWRPTAGAGGVRP